MAFFKGEASAVIDAPAELVWDHLADLPRMGERSPICRRVEWLPGSDSVEVGARFRGVNRYWYWRWGRECVITEAERGRSLAFSTQYNGEEHTRWRYDLEAVEGGTRVTESYASVAMPGYVRLMYSGPHLRRARIKGNASGMERTLARLKTEVEAERA